MSTFVLPAAPKADSADRMLPDDRLGSAILVHYVRWFISVRWAVVAVFIAAGSISHFAPALVMQLGLAPPHLWTWLLAGVLAAANALFWLSSRPLTEASRARLITGNIWLQIVVDLVVLTFLVHFVGSTSTFIAFAYLFHIVLACIFFAPAQSLLVTLMATGLYLLCVRLESLNLWYTPGMIPLDVRQVLNADLCMLFAFSAVFVWLVVWYLVSSLSTLVRERDRQLEAANQRLLVADEEKNRLMLRTTHDLKAPFSGIESNIQRLKMQYWDQLPAPVQEIVDRIEARGLTLSNRIRDILLLGDLRTGDPLPAPERVEIDRVLRDVSEELDGQAQERKVRLQITSAPLATQGCARHYFVLLSNVIANAISYSKEGGLVTVSLRRNDKEISLIVQDAGIGITAEALPRIFDEYYRTKEAAQHNPNSTGLGLAIVKEIAQKEGLTITVTSEVGQGTTFSMAIPVNRCEFGKDGIPWQKS